VATISHRVDHGPVPGLVHDQVGTGPAREVHIEREPITDANAGAATDGPAISEEEHEVVLHAEEPVVEKRMVPKERVRLDEDVVTENVEVEDEVRHEEIDIAGAEEARQDTR
jgi:stress response protein YsnF